MGIAQMRAGVDLLREGWTMTKTKGCLIGCGSVAAIFFILVGFIGYQLVQKTRHYAQEWSSLAKSYNETNEAFAFVSSPDGLLDPERFGLFLEVRNTLIAQTGDEFRMFEAVFMAKNEQKDQSFGEVIQLARQIAQLPIKVGHKHVGILKENQMSFAEYKWCTAGMLATIREGSKQGESFCWSLYDRLKTSEEKVGEINKSGSAPGGAAYQSVISSGNFPKAVENVPLLLSHQSAISDTSEYLWLDCLIVGFAPERTAAGMPDNREP
ncbi:MAG TPA: hypothetical protein PKH07_00995 [bacterium]|nr:hypothetical protein [bacterium]